MLDDAVVDYIGRAKSDLSKRWLCDTYSKSLVDVRFGVCSYDQGGCRTFYSFEDEQRRVVGICACYEKVFGFQTVGFINVKSKLDLVFVQREADSGDVVVYEYGCDKPRELIRVRPVENGFWVRAWQIFRSNRRVAAFELKNPIRTPMVIHTESGGEVEIDICRRQSLVEFGSACVRLLTLNWFGLGKPMENSDRIIRSRKGTVTDDEMEACCVFVILLRTLFTRSEPAGMAT